MGAEVANYRGYSFYGFVLFIWLSFLSQVIFLFITKFVVVLDKRALECSGLLWAILQVESLGVKHASFQEPD